MLQLIQWICLLDYPCFAWSCILHIGKRAPEKTALLKQLYEEFDRAMSQDEDRASFRINSKVWFKHASGKFAVALCDSAVLNINYTL